VALCMFVGAFVSAGLPAQPASGQEISGTYSAQQTSSTASDAQLTLSVSLTSSSDATLRSTSVALRSVLSGTTQDLKASFSLPPQGSTDFTATVTITQAEYKLWQQGARPLLVLEMQSSDETQITQTVALVPSVHAEAN